MLKIPKQYQWYKCSECEKTAKFRSVEDTPYCESHLPVCKPIKTITYKMYFLNANNQPILHKANPTTITHTSPAHYTKFEDNILLSEIAKDVAKMKGFKFKNFMALPQ